MLWGAIPFFLPHMLEGVLHFLGMRHQSVDMMSVRNVQRNEMGMRFAEHLQHIDTRCATKDLDQLPSRHGSLGGPPLASRFALSSHYRVKLLILASPLSSSVYLRVSPFSLPPASYVHIKQREQKGYFAISFGSMLRFPVLVLFVFLVPLCFVAS